MYTYIWIYVGNGNIRPSEEGNMIDHYNAFISYRHAPLDSKIAEHVQKTLERFHIPDKIRKSTGKKRIERVFRDKDELPTTSDLSETIYGALDDADYLIVICSENTKESMWVTREIEYFLSTHSRDKVLTVLAGGEPEKVIPEILKSEEREVVGEDGEKHKIRVSLEPLSCDYRLPRGKADREELPRLASALIGCSYDELMNRRRAYKIRRLSLIFALIMTIALAFGLYMFDANRRIEESLEEAMRQRSIYLANESQRLYEEGDRIAALHVALASLPENYPDGVVPPETVRALADASMAYVTSSTLSVDHAWNYYMPYRIENFEVSYDGSYLAARDSTGYLQVWDTNSHEIKLAINTGDNINQGMVFLDDRHLAVLVNREMTVYDSESGEEYWELDINSDKVIRVIPSFEDDEHVGVVTSSYMLYNVRISDGSIDSSYNLPEYADGVDIMILDYSYDQASNRLAFYACEAYSGNIWAHYIGVMDLGTGATQIIECADDIITGICWLDGGNLCVSAVESYNYDLNVLEAEVDYINHCHVREYQTSDMSLVWENEFDLLGNSTQIQMFYLNNNKICCAGGTSLNVIDTLTGETYNLYYFSSPIVDITDRDEDGNPMLILEDGDLTFPNLGDSDYIATYKRFVEDIDTAVVNQGVYINRYDSSSIMYYDTYMSDKEMEWTEDSPDIPYADEVAVGDDLIAILDFSMQSGSYELVLTDPESNSVIGMIDLHDVWDYSYGYHVIGIEGDKAYVSCNTADGVQMLIIDSTDMSTDIEDISEAFISVNDDTEIHDGKICFFDGDPRGDLSVVIYDVASEEKDELDIDINADVEVMGPAIYCKNFDSVYVCFADREGLVNADNGHYTQIAIPRDWNCTLTMAEAEDRIFLISESMCIAVDEDGDVMCSFDTNGKQPREAEVFEVEGEEQLFVLFSDGALYRYKCSDLTLVSVTDTDLAATYLNTGFDICYKEDEGFLCIYGSTQISIIDTEYWYEISYIRDAVCYHPGTDRLFVLCYDPDIDETHIASFRHYTVEELVDKAYEAAGDSELPDAVRAQYGI